MLQKYCLTQVVNIDLQQVGCITGKLKQICDRQCYICFGVKIFITFYINNQMKIYCLLLIASCSLYESP